VDTSTLVSADVLDVDQDLVPSSILVYIDGALAYDGASGFVAPFSGTVSTTTVDGYDGYHLSVARSVSYSNSSWIMVRVVARDTDDLVLDEIWQFYTVTVLAALRQGPYEISLDAEFSGPMMLSTLQDASYFSLDRAYVRALDPLPPGSAAPMGVRLWVEGFRGEQPFTLTISPLVRDVAGNVLPPSGRVATILPFQSSAFLSNTDGFVRSWHESRLILKDGLRAYLADTRGMDVFDIEHGLGRSVKWAQILDSYGTRAACILGTANYAFEDMEPPFLANRSPTPGATGVPLGTNILLSVADLVTAVEVTAVAVYVNGRLAFGGASDGGWANGYGGQVSVGHQIIDIRLYPPAGGIVVGTNTVSVLAADLVGNLLDTSYTFTVGAPPPTAGGFGTGGFGTAPFGE